MTRRRSFTTLVDERVPLRVSVIVPTFNEALGIEKRLNDLMRLVQPPDDLTVVDGGSQDGTMKLARGQGARVLESRKGRAYQQNAGAQSTNNEVLLFLHADCRLEPGAIPEIKQFLTRHPRCPGGCFRMKVDHSHPLYQSINTAAHLRAAWCGVPYGDQGLFVQRQAFEQVGGFPPVPLMEDVLLSLALNKIGRLALLHNPIHVSARRWQKHGILRQSLRNWILTAAAALGVPPSQLARFYPTTR